VSNAPRLPQWQTGTKVVLSLALVAVIYIYLVYVQSIYMNLQPFGKTSLECNPATKTAFGFFLNIALRAP